MTLDQWVCSFPRSQRRAAEAQLAAGCGVSASTVRQWRYQTRPVPSRLFESLASATDSAVTVADLARMAAEAAEFTAARGQRRRAR